MHLLTLSVHEETNGMPLAASYRISKNALNMLTRCVAMEYSKDMISVAIHPGISAYTFFFVVVHAMFADRAHVSRAIPVMEQDGSRLPWGETGEANLL